MFWITLYSRKISAYRNMNIQKILAGFLFVIPLFFLCTLNVNAAPTITNFSENKSSYSNNTIPKYEKLEVTFSVNNSVATNFFFPYAAGVPPGLTAGTGISVDAQFLPPGITDWNQAYRVPAFYYQEFMNENKNNFEWMYPTANYSWKVRFSPDRAGTWKYNIRVQDSSGIFESAQQQFSVGNSAKKGFIKVSSNDKRYFEYDDGTYFPGLGIGFDLQNADRNPTLSNVSNFQSMGANGMNLSRIWFTQYSPFGEAYGKWGSHNRFHQTQEPRLGIVSPVNSQFATNYPGFLPPNPPSGSEYYLWLEFNETVAADGQQPRFTPCRYSLNTALKKDISYRVRVRYQTSGMEGPLVPGLPYGFAVKTSSRALGKTPGQCNNPAEGTVITATYNPTAGQTWTHYPDPQNPNWSILEGTLNNSGASAVDYLPYLYLTFNNVKSVDSDKFAGHVFIDQIWLEEIGCTNQCANIIQKPWMSMHQYVNQKGANIIDKMLNLAEQNNVYLKAVMLEKNDRIFQTIDYNGQQVANQSIDNFYGNLRNMTKVRWLQQAWWRYMQARWGYSPNIHSWELLNEGDPRSTKHWTLADEFAKYMHCGVFGVNAGSDCTYDHINSHLVTTSFSNSAYPGRFWNNSDGVYPDLDYVDQHMYATEGTTDPSLFYDSANFSYWLSTLSTNFAPGSRKPFIRGETAWSFTGTNLFEINADGGEWLHDFIWAGINHGGLMEHFFSGGHFTRQIYNLKANPPYDHRPVFGTYYRFIKDEPLSNGKYQEIGVSVSNNNLRVWGQKDLTNKRAHLLIQNKNHTWKSVVDNVTVPVQSGTVRVTGFNPMTNYRVEWWNTYSGSVSSTQTTQSNTAGEITLNVSNLTSDTAAKILP